MERRIRIDQLNKKHLLKDLGNVNDRVVSNLNPFFEFIIIRKGNPRDLVMHIDRMDNNFVTHQTIVPLVHYDFISTGEFLLLNTMKIPRFQAQEWSSKIEVSIVSPNSEDIDVEVQTRFK